MHTQNPRDPHLLQYWSESMASWTNIPYDGYRENAFLLYPNDTIRFYPAGNVSGESFIEVLAAEGQFDILILLLIDVFFLQWTIWGAE